MPETGQIPIMKPVVCEVGEAMIDVINSCSRLGDAIESIGLGHDDVQGLMVASRTTIDAVSDHLEMFEVVP